MNTQQIRAAASAIKSTLGNAAFSDTFKNGYAQGAHRVLLSAGVDVGGDVGRTSKRIVGAWADQNATAPAQLVTVELAIVGENALPTNAALVNAITDAVDDIVYYGGGDSPEVQSVTIASRANAVVRADGSVGRAE